MDAERMDAQDNGIRRVHGRQEKRGAEPASARFAGRDEVKGAILKCIDRFGSHERLSRVWGVRMHFSRLASCDI